MIFLGQTWRSIKTVLRRIWKCMVTWKPMFKDPGAWSRPMVQLSGGGFIKTFGAKSGVKKFKMGPEWLNT